MGEPRPWQLRVVPGGASGAGRGATRGGGRHGDLPQPAPLQDRSSPSQPLPPPRLLHQDLEARLGKGNEANICPGRARLLSVLFMPSNLYFVTCARIWRQSDSLFIMCVYSIKTASVVWFFAITQAVLLRYLSYTYRDNVKPCMIQ